MSIYKQYHQMIERVGIITRPFRAINEIWNEYIRMMFNGRYVRKWLVDTYRIVNDIPMFFFLPFWPHRSALCCVVLINGHMPTISLCKNASDISGKIWAKLGHVHWELMKSYIRNYTISGKFSIHWYTIHISILLFIISHQSTLWHVQGKR